MKLRVGLIGCGGIGRHHASRLVKQENAVLAGVTDTRLEAAAAAGAEFGAPVFESCEALLASPEIDAVLIGTPNFTHRDFTLAACAAGKHIFCEKPMARTVRECDEMIAAAQSAGVKLMIGQVLRLMPPFVRVREMVASGEFGRPMVLDIMRMGWSKFVEDWRHRPDLVWGILYEVNVHELDLMRSICGEVAEVHATIGKLIRNDTGYEDLAVVTLRFRSGAVGLLRSSDCVTVGTSEGRVMCEKGTIAYRWGARSIEYRLADQPKSTTLELDAASFEDAFAWEQRSFVEWVLFDRAPIVTAYDGRSAIELAQAAYLSAERGSAVSLPL